MDDQQTIGFQKEKFDSTKELQLHKFAHKIGGFHMNANGADIRILPLVGSAIKQVTEKLKSGDFNVANITKPIILTCPLSMLEAISNDYIYCSTYLSQAVKIKDPLQRMQLVTTALVNLLSSCQIQQIANLHLNYSIIRAQSPIDWVLGETLELEKEDGSKFYAEAVLAEPPTASFLLIAPNNAYKIYGQFEVANNVFNQQIYAEIHPTFTEIVSKSSRKRTIIFQDGKVYEATLPPCIIEGVLNGDRRVNCFDSFQITCLKDKLVSNVSFSYEYKGKLVKIKNKIASLFKNNNSGQRSDLVEVRINKKLSMDDDEEKCFTLSKGSGCWLSHLEFDNELFWRIDDKVLPWKSPSITLESDALKRLDRIHMESNENLAQKYEQRFRNEIENQSRKDMQNRSKYKK